MVTIGEFILARIDDDAFLAAHMVARSSLATVRTLDGHDVASRATWDPRRVLVSCVALRHLVVDHDAGGPLRRTTPCGCGSPGSACSPCLTLRAVALEWADHPDYQEEWRPHPVPRQRQSA